MRRVGLVLALLTTVVTAQAQQGVQNVPAPAQGPAAGQGSITPPERTLPGLTGMPRTRLDVEAPQPLVAEGPVDEAFAAYQMGRFLTAFQLATVKAEQGDRAAMTLLGELHLYGLAVKIDPRRAAEWYRLAAERGDREAIYGLALLTARGEGVPRDLAAARELFERASDQGQVAAAYNAAMLYLSGVEGDSPNYGRAARHLARAVEAGNADAMYALANLAREGRGVPLDPFRATSLLREAATKGLVEAQIEYAIRVSRGEGTEKDEAEAARWLRAAAVAGNAVAQNRLARLYLLGRGVARDKAEAAKWHMLARRSGLNDSALDQDLLLLTRAEREEAERRYISVILAQPDR